LEPGVFYQNIIFLNHIVRPKGYIYKDVVQPFVVSEWLAGQKFRVLYIRRNLAEVALSMLRQGWRYPGQASSRSDEPDLAMLEGLVRAEEALSRLPALRVEYDDLVADEEALWTALKRLYPERKLMRIPFINKAFQIKRAKTLAMRETPELANLARKIGQVRQRLAQGVSAA
jgi:hypothetical protein